jgi:8-oxo-dGTP pyrophosphatase MutT (NUDIX family)
MFSTIEEFAPQGTEAGVALVLQDDSGRYIFFLAGIRHQRQCPPGELFYAGIGGHREPDEGWLSCVRREAREEIAAEVDIVPSPITWHVPPQGPAQPLELSDRLRPLALCEMIHPPGTPRVGELYRIVIYRGRLRGTPRILLPDEVRGIVGLTERQVMLGPDRRPSLAKLLEEGACLVAGEEHVELGVRLYPIGTANALARILPHLGLRCPQRRTGALDP